MRNFFSYARQDPERPAVITADGVTITYGQTLADANRVSNLILSRGVRPGETVAALLPNSYEMLAVQRGVLQLPLYFTPVNWHLTAREVSYILRDSGARLVFVTDTYEDLVRSAVRDAGLDQSMVVVIGHASGPDGGRLTGAIDGVAATTPEGQAAGQRMLYTSGTTGRPKAVRRALTGASPEQASVAAVERAALYQADHEDGRYLSVAPLYHAAPLSYADQALDVGHTVVIMGKWSAADALDLITRYRITWIYLVPLMFQELLSLPPEVREAADTSHLRSVIHTAAPCPVAVKRAMIEWLGPILVEIYGGTEGSVTAITSEEWLRKPGSVGRARKNVSIKILDEQGSPLPPGEVGTIYFENTALPFVYLNDPEKTAATRVGGHVTLGDIGYLDEDGYLYLCDRSADLIISGGVNIYPAEVEHALLELPGVRDACVVGRPDPHWGESVHAVVVVDTPEGREELEQRLTAGLRERIAGFKVPRSFEFVGALPRSETGKLLRREVRARVVEEVTRSASPSS